MRLFEFADAEAQVALWKLISDSVWRAIASERQNQAQAAAQKAVKKPKSSPRPKTAKLPPVMPSANAKPRVQQKPPQTKSKKKLTPQAAALAQKQATPVSTPSNSVRSNLAAPQTPVTSSASRSGQNAAKAQSVAQAQRQLDPLAHDETMKRLTR